MCDLEVILVSVLETGLPDIAVPPGATITSRSAVRIWINPRTAELFQLTFAAKGGGLLLLLLQPPWILVFPTEFLREIFHRYSFVVKESKGDS